MPATIETSIEWKQRFAWWPIYSTWSKKRIWFKKYWQGDIYYDAMGRPPIKDTSWKLVYTQNEYLLMLLRKEHKYEDAVQFTSVRGLNPPN